MDTKEKILHTALDMFNVSGSENITVRHIAAEAGISHGNLCYHFKNTDEIVQKLYEQLVTELDQLVAQASAQAINMEHMVKFTYTSYGLLYKYKFLMLDFVHVMRRIPAICTHYRMLTERRKMEFKFLIDMMIKAGYFKPEPTNGFFDALIRQWTLTGDFWIASAEILYHGEEKDKIAFYVDTFFMNSIPLMTEKGREEWELYKSKGNYKDNPQLDS